MIIECVPNVSEGRDLAAVDRIAAAVPAGLLLDCSSDPDHNRSVLTLAGGPEAVAEAAFQLVRTAVGLIDLRRHDGVHPRTGASDVLPFVPVSGITLQECAVLARKVGQRIWDELQVPVYLYEAAAVRPACRRLENIRRGGLEPDIGTGRHISAGACVVGARKFLIALNILLRTENLALAKRIAGTIREASGGLPGVKALGLPLPSQGGVQVSMNVVDFEATPLRAIYRAVEQLSRAAGVEVAGTELIGLIPRAALEGGGGKDIKWLNLREDSVLENRLDCGGA